MLCKQCIYIYIVYIIGFVIYTQRVLVKLILIAHIHKYHQHKYSICMRYSICWILLMLEGGPRNLFFRPPGFWSEYSKC